jgi:hypothetical protein
MVNRSVADDSSVDKLARLPKLHPGQLPANQTGDRSDVGSLADTDVGEVPQSCPNTLAEIDVWTDHEPFWRMHAPSNIASLGSPPVSERG